MFYTYRIGQPRAELFLRLGHRGLRSIRSFYSGQGSDAVSVRRVVAITSSLRCLRPHDVIEPIFTFPVATHSYACAACYGTPPRHTPRPVPQHRKRRNVRAVSTDSPFYWPVLTADNDASHVHAAYWRFPLYARNLCNRRCNDRSETKVVYIRTNNTYNGCILRQFYFRKKNEGQLSRYKLTITTNDNFIDIVALSLAKIFLGGLFQYRN